MAVALIAVALRSDTFLCRCILFTRFAKTRNAELLGNEKEDSFKKILPHGVLIITLRLLIKICSPDILC